MIIESIINFIFKHFVPFDFQLEIPSAIINGFNTVFDYLSFFNQVVDITFVLTCIAITATLELSAALFNFCLRLIRG